MKQTLIIIIVALALGGAYWIFGANDTYPLIQDQPSNGKLNINVVCESALSYMTFESGAAADAFVAECKEGKHPEVIGHYKAQMNLGDGAAI